MLQSLSRMPADMSSDSRRQLLNAVTDLFLLDGEPSDTSKSHYGDIALRTLPHLESEDRKQYADSVAATRQRVYAVVDAIRFDGAQFRRDIGWRALEAR